MDCLADLGGATALGDEGGHRKILRASTVAKRIHRTWERCAGGRCRSTRPPRPRFGLAALPDRPRRVKKDLRGRPTPAQTSGPSTRTPSRRLRSRRCVAARWSRHASLRHRRAAVVGGALDGEDGRARQGLPMILSHVAASAQAPRSPSRPCARSRRRRPATDASRTLEIRARPRQEVVHAVADALEVGGCVGRIRHVGAVDDRRAVSSGGASDRRRHVGAAAAKRYCGSAGGG